MKKFYEVFTFGTFAYNNKFETIEKAEELFNELKEKGFTYIELKEVKEGPRYRHSESLKIFRK